MQSTKLINNFVVFSFDNPQNLHTSAKFYRYLDTLRAMQKLSREPSLGTGMWMGSLEPAIMMDYNDFMEHVLYSGFVNYQECFLKLNPVNPRSTNYQGILFGKKPPEKPYIGIWTVVSEKEAFENGGYSYFGDLYFVCK